MTRSLASKPNSRIDQQRARDAHRPAGDKQRNEAAHVRAECAPRDHPSLGRWLTQQPNGRLKVNKAKIKTEERPDSEYLIATSDPHISADDVALGYKNLLEAERGFRGLADYGASTTDSLSLHLLTSLDRPAPSGSTSTSCFCQGCFPPSLAFPKPRSTDLIYGGR